MFLAKMSPCNQAGAARPCTEKAWQARSFATKGRRPSAGLVGKDFFS